MRTLLNAFNGGVISQDAQSRTDLESYRRSCDKLHNFIPHSVGVAIKRTGFEYLKITTIAGAHLVDFVVADNLAYILEFSHNRIRVMLDGDWLTNPDGTTLEIVTVYSSTQVGDISVSQKANALYIVHPDVPPKRLLRNSLTGDWSILEASPTWGTNNNPNWTTWRDYPSLVVFYEDRLWFAATKIRNQKIWASAVGDYEDFKGGENADDSFDREIAGNGLNSITFLIAGRDLMVGTLNEEFLIKSPDGKGLSNTNISILSQTSYGCSRIKPIVVDKAVLFIPRSADKIREFRYSFAEDSYEARDLSVMLPLEDDYIINMVYQKDPNPIIWVVTAKGSLLGLTYNPIQKVNAWHTHDVGGLVKDIVVIPDTTTKKDALYISVLRNTSVCIEVLKTKSVFDSADYTYLDSYATYSFVNDTRVITGLQRFEGKLVTAVYDNGTGIRIDKQRVNGSQITLSNATKSLTLGLIYSSELTTVDIEVGNPNGALLGRKIKIVSVNFKISKGSGSFLYGMHGRLQSATHLGEEIDGYTGDLPMMNDVSEDTKIEIKLSTVYPFKVSLMSVVYKVTEGGL